MEEKEKTQNKSTFNKALKKNNQRSPLLNEILSIIYYQFLGAILCLVVLFALTGGKNYFKLYKELNKVIDTYDTITKDYYGKIDKEKLVDNAVNAMTESIKDSYTNYSDEDETNVFMENVEGTYEGIGVSVTTKNKKIIVVKVFDDSPAHKAGIKENDIIIKIDDKDLTDENSDDLAKYIKDNKNKKMTLTIVRNNKEKEITITRTTVAMPTVSGKIIDKENNIGYIQISIFSSITEKQFKSELKKLEKKNINALIIDVRNNSGGYLNTVTDISSLFLEKGKIIYQLKDDKGITKIKDKTNEKRTYPIAVLTNRASASASEILAAAIKDSYGGYIVGTNTYGKGTVQKAKKLSDGSMIKYTIQKWLTPKGKWVNDVGVDPTEYIEYDSSKKEDNQLQKAIDILKNK